MSKNWKDLFPKEDVYYEVDYGIVYNADSLKLLEQFPKSSVDMVVLDPPYYMLEEATTLSFTSYNRVSMYAEKDYYVLKDLLTKTIDLIAPIIKPSSSVCIFSPHFTSILVQDLFKEKGFNLKSKFIWLKQGIYEEPIKKHSLPPSIYRNIFCFTKEEISSKSKSRFLLSEFRKRFRSIPEKPVRIVEKLIKENSKENDIILDPFAGSGTTAIACERRNRRWIIIEKEKKYCDIIINRVNNLHKEVLRYG